MMAPKIFILNNQKTILHAENGELTKTLKI